MTNTVYESIMRGLSEVTEGTRKENGLRVGQKGKRIPRKTKKERMK